MYEVLNWNCLQNKQNICSYLVVSFYAKIINNNNIVTYIENQSIIKIQTKTKIKQISIKKTK